MQNKFRTRLRELHIPKFVIVTASTILGAIFGVMVDRALQGSLNNQIIGYYLMIVVVLICLIIVTYFLIEIEELVQNRNYTKFIKSKSERLSLMIERIRNAEESIYIISDLSSADETKMAEHKNYLKELNRMIRENPSNEKIKIQRIIVPPYSNTVKTETDAEWIYKIPVADTYLEHFQNLRKKDKVAPKHYHVPRNVSLILIDKKYLFLKPEITYGDENLDTLMDGGIYLEQYTKKGIVSDFVEGFEIMFGGAHKTDITKFSPKTPKNVDK